MSKSRSSEASRSSVWYCWRNTPRSDTPSIATALMVLAALIVAIPLVLVLWSVISRGASVISGSFLTGPIPPQTAPSSEGGVWPAILGTLLITGMATLIAVPLGVLGAIYLSEYGGTRPLARVVRFMSEVMTGVPSIVMGLFVFAIWVLHRPPPPHPKPDHHASSRRTVDQCAKIFSRCQSRYFREGG